MSHFLYLGTHEPSWLPKAGVPLFISHRRLSRLRGALPVAAAPWALDSGGFSELSLYAGWKTTAAEYVEAVLRYDTEIGQLEWAAPQDFMNEPDMLAKTGLSVIEHQRRTVANYLELVARWSDASDSEVPFIPVIQGYAVGEYLRCMDMYADAGVDLSSVPLVGVGSVCRRQHTDEIRGVFEAILERDPDLPLHGFGVQVRGFKKYGMLCRTTDSIELELQCSKESAAAWMHPQVLQQLHAVGVAVAAKDHGVRSIPRLLGPTLRLRRLQRAQHNASGRSHDQGCRTADPLRSR